MEKILVTGANGYIGKYLVKHLTEYGYTVIGTSRNKEICMNNPNIRYLDLMDEKSFHNICSGVDIVIHTATMDERKIKDNARDALLINAYGTRQLYLNAEANGVTKFIYFSTFHVYGKTRGFISEETEPMPVSDYGLTHYFAEQYLKQLSTNSNCTVQIIRLTNGIGAPLENADKWYLVLNDFCRTAFVKQEIILKSNGLPIRDFVAISDLMNAIQILIETVSNKKYELYNVSSQTTISIRDLAELVYSIYIKSFNNECKLDLPYVTEEEKKSVGNLYVSSEKIRKLGWMPREKISETIINIFDYLSKQSLSLERAAKEQGTGGKK